MISCRRSDAFCSPFCVGVRAKFFLQCIGCLSSSCGAYILFSDFHF
jgi:hypothetical protein